MMHYRTLGRVKILEETDSAYHLEDIINTYWIDKNMVLEIIHHKNGIKSFYIRPHFKLIYGKSYE